MTASEIIREMTLADACNAVARLEKENAELKKINADGLSELNHINGDLIIENEKLKKENAELKQRIERLDMAIDSDIPIADKLAELEKENAELKKQAKQFLNSEEK